MSYKLGKSLWFEFNEWQLMFDKCVEVMNKDGNFHLVISSHWLTSGYWIEAKADTLPDAEGEKTFAYNTVEEVLALKQRINDEIKLAARQQRSPRFTT